MKKLILKPYSFFLLAEDKGDGNCAVGSIFVSIDYNYFSNSSEEQRNPYFIRMSVTGKFSAVSVLTRCCRRGIGRRLVAASEIYTLEFAHEQFEKDKEHRRLGVLGEPEAVLSTRLNVFMEMGVINQRRDLFPWYVIFEDFRMLPHPSRLVSSS